MRVTFDRRHMQALGGAVASRDEVPERGEIRDMLLGLDDDLPPAPFPATGLLGLDIHRHWSSEHRTCLWFPHRFNGYRVAEIYLRYGKSEHQIRAFRNLLPPTEDEPSDLGGFPAHVHLAMGLYYEGFFSQLAVGPRAWLDLNHLVEALRGPSGGQLFSLLIGLDGAGYFLWWVRENERRIGDFQSAERLAEYLSACAGQDWLVIRRNRISQDAVSVTTEDLASEIGRLFPVFDPAARRRPP